jgi:hypothetical protein
MSCCAAPVALPLYNDINPCIYCPEAARMESSDSGSNLIDAAVDASVRSGRSTAPLTLENLIFLDVVEAKVEYGRKEGVWRERKRTESTLTTHNVERLGGM